MGLIDDFFNDYKTTRGAPIGATTIKKYYRKNLETVFGDVDKVKDLPNQEQVLKLINSLNISLNKKREILACVSTFLGFYKKEFADLKFEGNTINDFLVINKLPAKELPDNAELTKKTKEYKNIDGFLVYCVIQLNYPSLRSDVLHAKRSAFNSTTNEIVINQQLKTNHRQVIKLSDEDANLLRKLHSLHPKDEYLIPTPHSHLKNYEEKLSSLQTTFSRQASMAVLGIELSINDFRKISARSVKADTTTLDGVRKMNRQAQLQGHTPAVQRQYYAKPVVESKADEIKNLEKVVEDATKRLAELKSN